MEVLFRATKIVKFEVKGGQIITLMMQGSERMLSASTMSTIASSYTSSAIALMSKPMES